MENSRIPGEHFFTTSDNTALFYRHWPALQPGAKKVIVLFHRGHEHSGRLQHLVDELAMPDTAFYAWDARGHGKSSGPRGYSPSLARSVRDVDEFVRFAASDSQVGLDWRGGRRTRTCTPTTFCRTTPGCGRHCSR